MAKKVYDEDGLDMQKTDWSGDESTGNLPVSGRLVENYIKSIDDKATPTEELAAGDESPHERRGVRQAGGHRDEYRRDGQRGRHSVRDDSHAEGWRRRGKRQGGTLSKYSDDDKVVVNIDLTDASGSSLPASQYLSLGTGFVVRYAVGVGHGRWRRGEWLQRPEGQGGQTWLHGPFRIP